VALPQHQRVGRGDTVHDAADVDVDDRVPLVQREQLGVPTPHDARVVEHQVEPARTIDHLVDGGLHRRRVGDIEPCGTGVRPQRRGGMFGSIAVDIGADHRRIRAHQRPAQRRADARARPGDDRLLALETHCASASFITWPRTSG